MACISCSFVRLLPLRGWDEEHIWAFLSDLCPEHSALDSIACTTQRIRSQKGRALSVKTALVLIFSYQIPNFVLKGRFKIGIL